jgi:hypothetical protein
MQDRPSALELLAAVRAFLEDDVVPALDGRRRFHALVAANVLGIVERELAGEDAQQRAEWGRLAELLETPGTAPEQRDALAASVRAMTETLSARIRAGDADEAGFAARVRAHLRQTTLEKLAVANPRYADEAAVGAIRPRGRT